jgi:hypothetical protein
MQEYGTGRYNKKHSTFFAQMMKELGLRREVEWCAETCSEQLTWHVDQQWMHRQLFRPLPLQGFRLGIGTTTHRPIRHGLTAGSMLCRYFDLVPWQSLASMNQNFILTERRRHYLRYAGGLCYFEVCPL